MNRNASIVRTLLQKTYPNAHIALTNWKSPWELLVSVILAAQCTDVRVNIVTATLFKKYRTLDEYMHAKNLEEDIKSTGFYRNKAKNIRAAAKLIKEKFSGKVPKTMGEMLTIPGVARKTANVVLINAYNVVEGIPVDTHMIRLSQRLRLVNLAAIGGKQVRYVRPGLIDFKKDADPVKIERELMRVIPKREWRQLAYDIVDHGRAVCKAQNPNCAACPVRAYCPASRV